MKQLGDLLHRPRPEITQEVYAVATYYPGMIKVYIPRVPIRKNLPDWETGKKSRVNFDKAEAKTSSETPLERSIRRSQRKVRDYILCNKFELFFTITIAADRQNMQHSKAKLNTWLKNQRDRNGKFEYVIVPELHKDGAAHFHGVFSGYNGKLKRSRSANTDDYLAKHGKPVYEFEEYKSGFTMVQYIGDTPEDQAKVGSYIRKYITKSMISIADKRRYWSSKGLLTPEQQDNPTWYQEIPADDVYTNDYGDILTYTNLDEKVLPGYVLELTRGSEV